MSGVKKQVDSQALPNKEQALFRQLIKQYESKLYKKGIKTADQILKKFPENGETLAMKGLLLNCLNRKDEAYDLVKKGVKNNLRSHVCWHVYGLLYRSDREYDEAIKCYKNALRMDKDNLTVLRDLANLQIQMRDLPGFLETRQALIELKPTNAQSWISLALAHHLLGNHEVAATIIESYEGTVKGEIKPNETYEHGEILLYKASILEEGEKFDEALDALRSAESSGYLRDVLYVLETRSRLALKKGKYDEAENGYRKLLSINTENHRYHTGLQAAVLKSDGICSPEGRLRTKIAPAGLDALTSLYAELQREYPHSSSSKRLPLDFLPGNDQRFAHAASLFVHNYLAKGVPSLFSEVKPLYGDEDKAVALGGMFQELEAAVEKTGTLPTPLAAQSGDAPSNSAITTAITNSTTTINNNNNGEMIAQESPLVWIRLYLAHHHDLCGDLRAALRYVDNVLKECPSLIEAHTARSKILKHAGDVAAAAETAQRARRLDLADRYLNCTAVKALFRAGVTDRAEAMAVLFTKHGEQANNLYDMQATWYELASGRAYLAQGDLGRALKRFLKVDAHFADFVEDQFDFHQYCVRKQTMRAYVDMLRMEDTLYRHPVYAKAVHGAVQAYITLFENPPGSKEEEEAKRVAGMSAEEAKKYKLQKKKEEAKRKKAEETAAAACKDQGGKANASGPAKDPDPDGHTLITTQDPLGEATKLVQRLLKAAPDRLDSHLLAFEVYSRRRKMLLALRSVTAAKAIAGEEHPEAHFAIVRFAMQVARATDGGSLDMDSTAAEVLQEEIRGGVLGGRDAAEYHAAWAAQHGNASLAHRFAGAKLLLEIDPGRKGEAIDGLVKAGPEKGTHAMCAAVLDWLAKDMKEEAAAKEYSKACAAAFPWSRVFGGAECVDLLHDDEDESAKGKGIAEDVHQKLAIN